MGKGDWVRPSNKKKFDEGFERAFGKREIKTWNPEEDDEQESDVQGETTSERGSTVRPEDRLPHLTSTVGEDRSNSNQESITDGERGDRE